LSVIYLSKNFNFVPMNRINHIVIKTLASILLLVSLLLIINNALFIHIHKLPDGNIIAHSHPYNKSENLPNHNQHNHTNSEILLLLQLQTLIIVFIVGIVFYNLFNHYKKIVYFSNNLKVIYYSNKLSRAPPFFQ